MMYTEEEDEGSDTLAQVKALHAALNAWKPMLLQAIKEAMVSEIAGGFAFGQWMVTKNGDIYFLLMALEELGFEKSASSWLDQVLIESGRFERTSPRSYVTYKVR